MKSVFSLACAFLLLAATHATAQPREPLQRPPQPRETVLPSPYPAPLTYDQLLTLQLLQQPAITFPTQTTCISGAGLTICDTK